jgi:putative nucleotidyltransferase with HDIG domain
LREEERMSNTISKNQEIQSRTTKEVLERIETLPSLSNVVGEFLELTRRDIFTGKDVERIIRKDQVLVSRILKLANSSYFGKSRSIKTITDAVVLIGMENTKKIVYAVSSEHLIRRDFKVYQYPNKGFWLHSMGVGITCRALAEKAKESFFEDEEAFVAGLVHDIGKLIIDDFLKPNKKNISIQDEIEAIGIDHTKLGELIMRRWNIPDVIAEAVRYHHHPSHSGQLHCTGLMVNVADSICNFWGVGTQPFMDLGEEIDTDQYSNALQELKIPESGLEGILWKVRQKLADLEDLYGEDDL